jgi:cytochrome b6-f complex iron-sulfur subunit
MIEKKNTRFIDSEKSDSAGGNSSRRNFLNTLWVILGVLGFAEVVALVLGFFRPRRPGEKADGSLGIIEAGSVDKFSVNSVTAFVRGRFYLSRLEDGGFLALSRKCTHLGCTVPWSSKEMKFMCPCHASVYNIRGEVVRAPASRPLDLHPVFIENNVVKVDTSKVIKRSVFRSEQVVYPKKS